MSRWRDFWEAQANDFRRDGPGIFREYLQQRPELFLTRSMHEVGGIVNADALDRRAQEFAEAGAGFFDLVGEQEEPDDLEAARARVSCRLKELDTTEIGGVMVALGGLVERALADGKTEDAGMLYLILRRVLDEARQRDPEDTAAVAAIFAARFGVAMAAGIEKLNEEEDTTR